MNSEEERQRNSDKCIQKAEEAYSSKNFDKAESLLLKAERFYPTELAKRKLADVRAAKILYNPNNTRNENHERRSDPNENHERRSDPEPKADERKYHKTETDQRYAEKCIAIAKLEISEGNYDRAHHFIVKSNRLYPSKETESLLKQINELKLKADSTKYSSKETQTSGCKEDAEKCIDVAQDELAAGNLARAEHLLLKAERLCPSNRAKDLLKQIDVARASGKPETGTPVEVPRKPPRPPPKVNPPKPRPQGPSPKHVEAVRRVTEASSDYAMFHVASDSPMEDIRKAYKKLAALLHPDKNKAPGASEAFLLMRVAYDRIKGERVLQCAICFEVMLKTQELQTLSCSHNFHAACIRPWLDEQRTCPVCRKTV